MELKFYEIVINSIEIDIDTFREYIDSCKEAEIVPTRDDFMKWLTDNYYLSDFIVNPSDVEIKYTLTNKHFNNYLNNILNNDN